MVTRGRVGCGLWVVRGGEVGKGCCEEGGSRGEEREGEGRRWWPGREFDSHRYERKART